MMGESNRRRQHDPNWGTSPSDQRPLPLDQDAEFRPETCTYNSQLILCKLLSAAIPEVPWAEISSFIQSMDQIVPLDGKTARAKYALLHPAVDQLRTWVLAMGEDQAIATMAEWGGNKG